MVTLCFGTALLSLQFSRPQHPVRVQLGALLKLVPTANHIDISELGAWMGPQPACCLASARVCINAGAVQMLHEAVKSDFPDCCAQKCGIAGELPVASVATLKVLLLVCTFPAAKCLRAWTNVGICRTPTRCLAHSRVRSWCLHQYCKLWI